MCGIIAILLADKSQHVNQLVFDGLTALQHRGQDAAGMVTCENGHLNLRKDNGLVSEVFHLHHMIKLRGNMGIGHVRYPTAGSSSCAEAQPFYTNYPYGICSAHNGNLVNAEELAASLVEGCRHVNTSSDSEVLMNVFAQELEIRKKKDLQPEDVFDAVTAVMGRIRGAYAVVMLIKGVGLLGFRDPHGIRPLVFGSRGRGKGRKDSIIASESVAIDTLGFELERDVGPGEAVLLAANGGMYTRACVSGVALTPCIFEYVYFARPDSILDGVQVYQARLNMGECLGLAIRRAKLDHDIDVVIPVPDTSRTSALQCAYTLNKPFREGFIKNRYIARTFILPGQATRKKTVRMKLNTIRSEFRGKNVLLVDDSIVRGTTSRELVLMAKEAGALKVYITSAAPPVRHANVYGIDIPTKGELIAHERDEKQIAEALCADWVVFQDLQSLRESVQRVNPALQNFEASCFDGVYVTPGVTKEYLDALQKSRSDEARFGGADGDDESTQTSSSSSISTSSLPVNHRPQAPAHLPRPAPPSPTKEGPKSPSKQKKKKDNMTAVMDVVCEPLFNNT